MRMASVRRSESNNPARRRERKKKNLSQQRNEEKRNGKRERGNFLMHNGREEEKNIQMDKKTKKEKKSFKERRKRERERKRKTPFPFLCSSFCYSYSFVLTFLFLLPIFQEIGRWITPFRRGVGHWLTDITPIAPLLTSQKCNFSANIVSWLNTPSWVISMNLRFNKSKPEKGEEQRRKLPLITKDEEGKESLDPEKELPFQLLDLFAGGRRMEISKNFQRQKAKLTSFYIGQFDSNYNSIHPPINFTVNNNFFRFLSFDLMSHNDVIFFNFILGSLRDHQGLSYCGDQWTWIR